MPRTLVIRLDPHELVPVYSTGWTDFTLALTTSVDSTGAAPSDPIVPKNCLTPWHWATINSFVLWNVPTTPGTPPVPVTAGMGAFTPPQPGRPPSNWATFIGALDASLPDPVPVGAATYSDPYYACEITPSGDPRQRFAPHLATLQHFGASTPQWLNLTSFVRAASASLPAARRIAVLPVIQLPSIGGGPAVVLTPNLASAVVSTPATAGGAKVTFTYTATPAAALAFHVRGEVEIDAPWPPDPDALIDPDHLLVRAGDDGNFRRYPADWLAGLAARLAEGIDLPTHIIAWAERLLSSVPTTIPTPSPITPQPNQAGRLAVRRAFLAACRSVAHAGAKAEAGGALPVDPSDHTALPDLASVAGELIGLAQTTEDDNQRDLWVTAIRAADALSDAGYAANLDTWRDWLSKALGAAANSAPVLAPGALTPGTDPLTQADIDAELRGLRDVNKALWDPSIAAQIMTSQWQPAIAITDPVIANARAKAAGRDRGLRRQLSLGSFDPVRWAKLFAPSAGDTDVVAICKAFPGLVVEYATELLGLELPTGSQFTAFLTWRASQYAAYTAPTDNTLANGLLGFDPGRPLHPEYGDTTTAGHPGGLVFAFDRANPYDPSLDYLNRLAGVVVFLKQGNANAVGHTLAELATPANLTNCFGAWRAPNIADLYITYNGTDSPLIERGILTAIRFTFPGGVRHAVISYDAQPLIALSPGSLTAGQGTPPPAPRPIAGVYHVAAVDGANWAPLPELRFGQVYALQAFAQTHAGALPSELVATNGHPAYLKPWSSDVDIGTVPATGSVLARVARYLRRVPVGSPSWQAVTAPADFNPDRSIVAPALPAFPSSVAPLAPELPPWGANGNRFDLPLVLLQPNWDGVTGPAPATTSFAFQLRLPSIDQVTWDRWIATDAVRAVAAATTPTARKDVAAAFRALRKQIRGEYQDRLAKRMAAGDSQVKAAQSVAIDDPAVSGFVVTLTDLSPPGVSSATRLYDLRQIITPLPAALGTAGLEPVRNAPVTVKVSVVDQNWGVKPYDAATTTLEILVPRGRVFEVDITTLVGVQEFFSSATAAVPARMLAAGDFGYTALNTTWVQCGTMRFVVEVVTDELPSAQVLRDALTASVMGDNLLVRLATQRSAPFAYCQWADLTRQVWRWDGRDQPPFPWPTANSDPAFDPEQQPGPDTVANWEVHAFGAHSDNDYFGQNTRLAYGDALANPPILYEESIEGDRRALYSRFAVRVISRYQAILPPGPAHNALGVSSLSAAKPDELASWRRIAIRARWDRPLPRPNLKFLLPLSRSDAAATSGPTTCLMAVFDDTWYSLAGVAESLGMEVVNMTPADAPGTSLPEIGYDPIVSAKAWDKNVTFDTSGAIGFTFDTDTDAPLFSSTAFLINSSEPLDPWTFVKLRFQRTVPQVASFVQLTATATADEIEESWTHGHWAQILPDAGRFACDPGTPPARTILAKELRLVPTPGTGGAGMALSFVDGNNVAVTLWPTQVVPAAQARTAAAFVQFELWLVVTIGIKATGFESPNSKFAPETYVLTVPLTAGAATLPPALSPTGAAVSSVFVRVVEVQRRIGPAVPPAPAPTSIDPLWADIFPAEIVPPVEPIARIVRVSDPIGIQGPKWPQPDATTPGGSGD